MGRNFCLSSSLPGPQSLEQSSARGRRSTNTRSLKRKEGKVNLSSMQTRDSKGPWRRVPAQPQARGCAPGRRGSDGQVREREEITFVPLNNLHPWIPNLFVVENVVLLCPTLSQFEARARGQEEEAPGHSRTHKTPSGAPLGPLASSRASWEFWSSPRPGLECPAAPERLCLPRVLALPALRAHCPVRGFKGQHLPTSSPQPHPAPSSPGSRSSWSTSC